jgi:hypothetical protein
MKIKVESFTNPITEDVLQPKTYSISSVKLEDTLYFTKKTNQPLPNGLSYLSYTFEKDFLISSIFLSIATYTANNDYSHGAFKIKIDNYPQERPNNDEFIGFYNAIIALGLYSHIKGSEFFSFYFKTPVFIKKGSILEISISDMGATDLHLIGIIKGVFNE